ncbi:MAG: hypothetical protein ACLQJR_29470 [Stellaceae bacterium]
MAGTPAQASTVDPVKWLAIVRRWCPAAPVEVPITLVKSLIEAAASGCSGQLRLGLLDDFVLGLDAQLCSNAQKLNKLKKETVRMAAPDGTFIWWQRGHYRHYDLPTLGIAQLKLQTAVARHLCWHY